jgi:hypothetical protein
MIRQILEVFFLAQVITEAVVEGSEKAIKDAGNQLQKAFKTVRHDSFEGNHRVEAAAEATKRDYEQVVISVKDLLSDLWVLVQECAKLPVSGVMHTMPKTTTTTHQHHKVAKSAR